ncbi:PilN domain-containing protein [Candidatus Dojkabacteria bacterium]|nr:PilN domain-containing protein [Candidatus Dojkabacteria bacterium]
MPKKPPKSLNLLEPAAAPQSTWDKIYEWVFNIGRYLMVGVEIVVLIAFASRFILDRQNNDLKESIDAKVSIIKAQTEVEKEIRGVQTTLDNISVIIRSQVSGAERFDNVFSNIPDEVQVDNLAMDQESVNMTCRAPNFDAVKELEDNFKLDSNFNDLNLSLSKSGQEGSQVDFSVTVKFAGVGE